MNINGKHLHNNLLAKIETPQGTIYRHICRDCMEYIGNPKNVDKMPAYELERAYSTTLESIEEGRKKYIEKRKHLVYSPEWYSELGVKTI
jgi:hypothetical protein